MSVQNRLGIPKPIAYAQIERLRLIGCTLPEIAEALGYSKQRVSVILRDLGVKVGGTRPHRDVAIKRDISENTCKPCSAIENVTERPAT